MKNHLLLQKPIYFLVFFICLILHSRNPTGAEEVLENPLVYCKYVNPIRVSIPSPPPPPDAETPWNFSPNNSGKRNNAWRTAFIILISINVALALISTLCLHPFTRRRLKKRTSAVGKVEEVKDMELHLKNSSLDESESSYDLLSYVWRHWNEGTQLELIDKTLRKDCPLSEAKSASARAQAASRLTLAGLTLARVSFATVLELRQNAFSL
ncbi:hypothetical protein MRB53_021288 [Persea americana]|uniref:Uncharacterized protein n=1 Tax=Persea americana TaxID=3435 RepID=A0ACC2L484_PERAE|nr:hypothetical protein MRB53_021288 [Persea americana]